MWDSTKKMAQAIARGISAAAPDVTIKLYNCSQRDTNDIITEVFKSRGVLMGSPTVNRTILSALAGIMAAIKGLSFKDKKAAAFGSYGWSGESVQVITSGLQEAGFEVVNEGIKCMWSPDEENEGLCYEFGQNFANALKGQH